MRTRIFVAVLFAAWSLIAGVPAGDFADAALPKGWAVEVSIRSTADLVANLDAAVAAASKGTKDELQPGMLIAELEKRVPFLVGEDALDARIHLLLPPVPSHMAVFGHAVILAGVTMEDLIAALESAGVGTKKTKPGVITITLPGRGAPPYFAEEIEDGLIVGGMSPNIIGSVEKAVAGGWRPKHWGDGDLSIAVDNPGDWLLTGLVFEHKLAEIRNWVMSDASPTLEGVDRDALSRTLDALAADIPWLEGELAGIKRFGLDFRFDGERFGMAMRLLSNPDTLLGKIGAAAVGRGAIEDELVKRVGDDAIQILCMAPFDAMLPGIDGSLPAWCERFFGQALPGHKDAIVSAMKDFFASSSGKRSGGSYQRGDAIAAPVVWMEGDNPAAMVEAQKKLAKATGDVHKALFPGYAEGDIVTMTEAATPDGVAYVKVGWDREFMRRFTGFCSAFFAGAANAPQPATAVPFMPNDISVLLAGDKNHVVTVGGALGPDALDAAMRNVPADRPMRDMPSAQAALADLKYRQNMYVLTNCGPMIKMMVMNGAGGGLGREELDKCFETVEPRLRTSDGLLGFAVGSDDSGAVVGDVFVPTDAIGMFIHNYALISQITVNEKTAENALRTYASAQAIFQSRKQFLVAGNTGAGDAGYADNFRNLYYGEMAGEDRTLQLISRRVADAFAGPTGGAPTMTKAGPAQEPEPYDGYLFLEPPGLDCTKEFALVAYPAEFGVTGNRILGIDSEGIVYSMILSNREGGLPARGETPAPLTPEESRFADGNLWEMVK